MDLSTFAFAETDALRRSYHSLATAALALLRARHELVCAYVTGSLTFGLGNPTSDLDIVGIVEGDVASYTVDIAEDGITCDVDVRSVGTVEKTMRMPTSWSDATLWDAPLFPPSRHRLTDSTNYQIVLGHAEWLWFLVRLCGGLALTGESWLAERRAEVDRERLQQCLVAHHGAWAAIHQRDTYGAILAGDLSTAWDSSYDALRRTAHMMLAGTGDHYPVDKFLRRRLVACPATRPLGPILTEAFDPPGGMPDANADLLKIIERRSLLAGLCSDSAMVTEMGLKGADQASLVLDALAGTGSWSRDPYTVTVPLHEEVLFSGRIAFVVTRPVALCHWLALRTRDLPDLCTQFSSITSIPKPDAFVTDALHLLVSRGFLVRAGHDA